MTWIELFGPGGVLAPLFIVLVAAAPIGEVRFSLPLAVFVYDMGWSQAVVLSLLGNLAIVPLLFWILPHGERLVRKVRIGTRFLDWLFARTRRRHSTRVEKYQEVALIVLVAIPLPGTGAWAGSLVAYLFGLPWRKAWPFVFAGVATACFFVLIISLTAEELARRWFLRA